jgi:hypothetical protein
MHCRACKTDKPEAAFYASNRACCKECVKARVTAHRLENIDRIRAYDRMRASQPHRVANNFKQSQAWRQEYPNRRRAQGLVQHALRSGRLNKQPCWVCGGDAVAHHPDYDRPLDVVWLCQPHHKQAHALVTE